MRRNLTKRKYIVIEKRKANILSEIVLTDRCVTGRFEVKSRIQIRATVVNHQSPTEYGILKLEWPIS